MESSLEQPTKMSTKPHTQILIRIKNVDIMLTTNRKKINENEA